MVVCCNITTLDDRFPILISNFYVLFDCSYNYLVSERFVIQHIHTYCQLLLITNEHGLARLTQKIFTFEKPSSFMVSKNKHCMDHSPLWKELVFMKFP